MTAKRFIPIDGSEYFFPKSIQELKLPNPNEEIKVWVNLRYSPSHPEFPSIEQFGKLAPGQRKYLGYKEFESLYGAHPDDVSKVVSYLEECGIRVIEIKTAQRTIHLEGAISAFNSAFNIELKLFGMPENSFRGYMGRLYVPEELKDIVTGVFGLDNRVSLKSNIRELGHIMKSPELLMQCPDLLVNELISNFRNHLYGLAEYRNASETLQKIIDLLLKLKECSVEEILREYGSALCKFCKPLYPEQIAKLYNFPEGASGKGQSIALIQFGGGYERSSLEKYFVPERANVSMPEIVDVSVDGGENAPGKSFINDAEVYLDIEVVGSIANDARIVVYFASDESSSYISALKCAVHDEKNDNTVISTSWGRAENVHMCPMEQQAYYETLFEACLKGITVCAASGDNGAYDDEEDGSCHVDFPASHPLVLGCGGTRFKVENGVMQEEVAWNDSLGNYVISSGGGVSKLFPVPFYQAEAKIFPISANPEKNTGRGVPDVSAGASMFSGYTILIGNMLAPLGGTSAAAPLWAALIALINEKLNTRVGFINPIIYRIFQSSDAFRSITEGNNGAYNVVPGWDACTGLGSPNGANLLEAIRNYELK